MGSVISIISIITVISIITAIRFISSHLTGRLGQGVSRGT